MRTSYRRLICLTIVLCSIAILGCSSGFDYSYGRKITGGDPIAGKQAIFKHDCTSCHAIPGFESNAGLAGPPLDHWSRQRMIEDSWHNTPDNLQRWIRSSESMNPNTVMKLLSINEKDARDIAAYLFSLR